MASSLFARKARALMIFVFLCVSTSCMYLFSLAYATPTLLETGELGTCTWKYERVNGEIVLTIEPTNGVEGELKPLDSVPKDWIHPSKTFVWRFSSHCVNTKRIVVKSKVKVRSSIEDIFSGFMNVESIDLSGLELSDIWNAKLAFIGCSALTSIDVSNWDLSEARTLYAMFYRCSALTSLDLSKWQIRGGAYMDGAFGAMRSLERFSLGGGAYIDKRAFDDVEHDPSATTIRTNWLQVNLSEGGTYKNPKGSVLKSADELVRFHSSRRQAGPEEYVQAATLTYTKAENTPASLALSRQSEDVAVRGTPLGCEVTGVASGKTIKWTVTKGGNGKTWSRIKTKLEKADIEAAAKDPVTGKLVSTTFTAELVDETGAGKTQADEAYTISFDVNLPSGAALSGGSPQAFDDISTDDKKEATIPAGYIPVREGYKFLGWSTTQAGGGALHQAGKTLTGITANMTLYAQWEDAITLTYAKKGTAESGLTLSRSSETLGVSGSPSGCEVTGLASGKTITWTVTSGGNSSASTWSRIKTKLEKDDIEAAAKKDGKLVSTTFTATLTNKTYTITFDANASGANVGELPQALTVEHGKEPTAPSPTLTWKGKLFTGTWNTKPDGSGISYKADEKIKNVVADMILYAQWEDAITLTYVKKGEAESGLTLSRSSETLGVSGSPSGCEVTGLASGKTITWTVTSGGNSSASTWSRIKTKLEKDDIEAAAKKDGKLVSTTFTATLTNKTYTITFDANASGANVGELPQALTVEHGKEPTAPSPTLTWKGKLFTGTWNTKPDGSGISYKADEKIKNVVADMILYAQWEDAITLTYVKKGEAESGLTLSRSSETLGVSGSPSGCEVTGLASGKTITWTVTSGGNSSASTWSRIKTKLEKDDIEAAAKKDGKLVSTTFTATLTNKTYTITFDANASGANVGELPQALTVEHGKEPTAPSPTLTWKGKLFTGRWNTKPDGSGISYKADEKIKNVVADMILYAQWEDAITLTYVKKGEAESGLTLSRSSETLGVSGSPSGCEVTGLASGKTITWTVTSGGNSSASTWSRIKTKLEKDDIEAAAKKDGKLVSTTFTATLTNKTYTITFDANASGANVGELPQALTVEHDQEATAPSPTLTWKGKLFTGRWNTKPDGSGISYKADEKIKNVVADMILYAQWEDAITLTYVKKGEAESGLTLSRSSETLGVSGSPSGCEVTGLASGKTITWTVTSGGNSSASTWSRIKTKLEKDDIEAAAKKDGKLVSTTFTATLTNKTYTITFDANASGADVGELPQALTVEHDQEATAPSPTLTWKGKLFTGRWNTKPDGSGISYKADEKIKNVVADMILYAQWEDAITLTYVKKGEAESGLTLSRSSETLGVSGSPSGCEVTGLASGKTITWTVTSGGNSSASTWSRIKTKLEKDDIEAAAKKDGKLVSTTFTAELVDETGADKTQADEAYTISFDVNLPSGAALSGGSLQTFDDISTDDKKEAMIPAGYIPVREGYKFLGWSTTQAGGGTLHQAGKTLTGITANMTLYAQWEDVITLTYAKKGTAESSLTFSRSSETLGVSGTPSGCEVTGVASGKTITWTVTSGGNSSASTWSRTKTKLEKADIEAAAKKDGKLVSTTFTAEITNKPRVNVVDKDKLAVVASKAQEILPSKTIAIAEGQPQTTTGQSSTATGLTDSQKQNSMPESKQVPQFPLTDKKKVSKRSPGSWLEHNGKIFYQKDGKRLTGWQHLSGTAKDSSTAKSWFCFDKNGIMLTGRHKLASRSSQNAKGEAKKRWFYFDEKTGRQVRGWVKDKQGVWYYYSKEDGAGLAGGRHELEGGSRGGKHWFCFDKDGLQIRGWNLIDNRWYYYSKEDGAGLAGGRHELEGGSRGGKHWFCFDKDGLQIRGWNPIGNQWYYYSKEDGAGLVGQYELKGGKNGGTHWFYFDEKTGAQIRGWKYIDYQNKWCYYSKDDGAMLKGQYELNGGKNGGTHWFYFDEKTGAQIRGWKYIDYQDKWCYYSKDDGAMLKGQHRLYGGFNGKHNWFYFDEITGAQIRGWKYIESQNKTCYYGKDGAMYKGWRVINGKWYYFNRRTGAWRR